MSEFEISVGRLEKLYKGKLPDWLIYLIEDGFLHTHHEKKEVKPPCKWCEAWKIFMSWRWSSSCVELQEAIHYLITLGKYMQVCPVCDARLEGK